MKNLAVAYRMKKKMAKGGMCYDEGGDVEKEPQPETSSGSSFDKETGKKISKGFMEGYAEGGHVKGVHKPMDSRTMYSEPGTSEAGDKVRWAKAYRHGDSEKFAKNAEKSAKEKHHEVLSEMKSMKKPELYADGGMVDDIMKKRGCYSEGGEVANDTGEGEFADEMPNEFDDLVLDSDSMDGAEYTGENSGDEIGNKQHDDENDDMVLEIMRSRKKKDRMPSPA